MKTNPKFTRNQHFWAPHNRYQAYTKTHTTNLPQEWPQFTDRKHKMIHEITSNLELLLSNIECTFKNEGD